MAISKELIHVIILIITITLSFVIPKTNLAGYDLQISAGLFIVLYLTKKFVVSNSPRSRLIESVIFSLVILLVVNTSGGVNSPFFFLVYFLLFSLSLLLEPVISLTATLTLIILYLVTLPPDQGLKQLLPIISLAFLTPFAMFMGKEFIETQKLKIKSQKQQEDTLLFLSLSLKNHLQNIKKAVENFLGDHELHQIKHHTREMERLIDQFEKHD